MKPLPLGPSTTSSSAGRATCREATDPLWRFLAQQGTPLAPAHLTRERVESFIIELLERYRPVTASRALPRAQGVLRLAGGGADDPRLPDGEHEAADRPEDPPPGLGE